VNASPDVPIERAPWPGNAKGLRRYTVPTAAKFIRKRIHDPRFRARAGQVLRDAGFPKSVRAKSEALRQYVKSITDYAADPLMSEMVVDPEITLCLPDAKMCMPIGDCDDFMCAVLALIGAAGMDVNLLLLEYGGGKQVHLMGAAKDERGQWLEVDVTTDKPVGHNSWAKTRTYIDPFDPKMMEEGEFKGGAFIGAGKAHDPTDPAIRTTGAGAGSVSDVLSYRALWDDYVLQTVCAYEVMAWALGLLAAGQTVPAAIDLTYAGIAGIPYCVRTIPTWDITGSLIDTTQFGDNPPTPAELSAVQNACTTSATSLLSRWNAYANSSDLEIVDNAAQILTAYQSAVNDTATVERPYIARYAPGIATVLPQGPNESAQAQLIAQLQAAQIVAGNVLTIFKIGVDGVLDSTATLSQWTAKQADRIADSATGLVGFLTSPWTLGVVALTLVGGVVFVIYKADQVAKIAGAVQPFRFGAGEKKKHKKRKHGRSR
jgi:hypothetical protein